MLLLRKVGPSASGPHYTLHQARSVASSGGEEEEALRATLFPKHFQPYFPSKRNILHFRCLDYFLA